ncbi:hypothetical protein AALA24_11515 [Anaerovoracaceae bacterium 42-11]
MDFKLFFWKNLKKLIESIGILKKSSSFFEVLQLERRLYRIKKNSKRKMGK